MTTSNATFAELADQMIQEAETTYVELTAAQKKVVEKYEQAKAGITQKLDVVNDTEKNILREIKEKFDDKRAALNDASAKLKDAYINECVSLGMRKEDVPFGETQIVRSVDNSAKTLVRSGANAVRGAKKWFQDAIND